MVYSGIMLIVFRVLGIIIFILSLLLLIAVPPAGIVGIILGVLFIFLSSKKFSDKIKISIGNARIRSEQASKKLRQQTEALKKKSVDIKTKEDQYASEGETVYIEYEDAHGDYSERTIEITRVYKKGDKLYINAYCFLACDERTFQVDRIVTMKDKYKGQEIKDIKAFFEAFLNQKSKKTTSATDLAASALES